MWRISVLWVLMLCVACGARRQADSEPAPPAMDAPSFNAPSFTAPAASPSTDFPSANFPQMQPLEADFPEVQFPVADFPEVQFPEITFPEVRVQQGQGLTVITLPADILFDFDKDTIRPDAEAALQQIRQVIRDRYPDKAIEIRGYTDSKGDDAYNQSLSERRSAAVQQWLTTQAQIPAAQMTTKGFGEANPVAPNTKPDGSDDPQGRQQNRRVEIVIRSEDSP